MCISFPCSLDISQANLTPGWRRFVAVCLVAMLALGIWGMIDGINFLRAGDLLNGRVTLTFSALSTLFALWQLYNLISYCCRSSANDINLAPPAAPPSFPGGESYLLAVPRGDGGFVLSSPLRQDSAPPPTGASGFKPFKGKGQTLGGT